MKMNSKILQISLLLLLVANGFMYQNSSVLTTKNNDNQNGSTQTASAGTKILHNTISGFNSPQQRDVINSNTQISTNDYFTYTFDRPYSFIRSGSPINFTVSPSLPQHVLYNWDSGTNTSTLPVAPTISPNNLAEVHVLNIFAQRPDNNKWESHVGNFTIDDTAIIVTKKSPDKTKVNGFENIDLNYYPSNILGRTWAFNNFPFTITEPITFPVDTNGMPIPGQQILHVKAVDQANRIWSYDFPYFVDFTAPTITPLNFINDTIIRSGTELTFANITPTSIYDDIYLFNFSWNNGPVFHTFPVVPSPNSVNVLKVVLSDEVGNYNTAYYRIVSKINFVKTPKLSYKPKEFLEASYSETPVFVNYTLLYNMNGTIITTNTSTLPQLPDINTNVTFIVNVMDSGYNWLNESFNIKIDSLKIDYVSSNPINNTVIDQTVLNATVNLVFGETPYIMYYNFNTTNTNVTTIPEIPLFTGVFKLTVYFSDLAGNWNKVDLIFRRIVKLSANITSSQIINPADTIQISSTGQVSEYSYFFNNNTPTIVTTSTKLINITAPTTSLSYVLYVTVKSNNTYASTSKAFTVRIAVNFLDSNTDPYKANTPINITFSEPPKSWYYVWDSVNDVTKYNFDQTPLLPTLDGTHILYVKSINSQGSIEFVSSKSFVTDNTAPTIILDTSKNTNNTFVKANTVLAFSSISPDTVSITYKWDSNTYQTATPTSITITVPASNGTHTLSITLQDNAKNVNQVHYVFYVDSISPTIYSSIANNSMILNSDTVTFNFSEPLGPLASYRYRGNVKAITNNEISLTDFGYGNKSATITISAVDVFENNNTKTFVFSVIDPALTYSFSVSEQTVLNTSYNVIYVSLSKPISFINFSWSNGVLTERPNLIYLTDTSYKFAVPSFDGNIVLSYQFETRDNYWVNNTISYVKDTIAPIPQLILTQVNTSSNEVRNLTINKDLGTIANIDANSIQTIYIDEQSDFYGFLTLTYGNGTNKYIKFSSSTDFHYDSDTLLVQNHKIYFVTPSKAGSLSVELTLTDKAGNIAMYTWHINVYDSPEVSPFSPLYIIFGAIITLALVKNRKKKYE